MAFDFNAQVDKADQIEKSYFGEAFTIDANSINGIFDQGFQEFEGVDDFYTTLEVITSELPAYDVNTVVVTRVSNGKTYSITKKIPSDTKTILVLV